MLALNFRPFKMIKLKLLTLLWFASVFIAPQSSLLANKKEGPIRVLFLGHESEHHNSNAYYPMLSRALGRDAIYFDYVTSVEEALGDAKYLGKFAQVVINKPAALTEDHVLAFFFFHLNFFD